MARDTDELPRMSIWAHVDALRKVLLRAGAVVGVLTVAFFLAMPRIFDSVFLAPTHGNFLLYRLFDSIGGASSLMPDLGGGDFHVEIININLASQFFIHMSTSFWLGVVFAFPVIIYLLWGFVAPALYSGERSGVRKAFLLGNIMFFIGVAVGYFVVFPVTLRFLADYQVSEQIPNTISLDSYMDNFLVLILMMGLIFELPLVAWLLGRMGLVNRRFFRKYRRHAVAGLLVLAALITPTGDPFTLMVVFLPIYLLWEFSAMLVPREVPSDGDDDDDASHDDGPYVPQYRSQFVKNS